MKAEEPEQLSGSVKKDGVLTAIGDLTIDEEGDKIDVISLTSSSAVESDDDSDVESCISAVSSDVVRTGKKLHCLLCEYSCSGVHTLKKHIYTHLTGKKSRKSRNAVLEDGENPLDGAQSFKVTKEQKQSKYPLIDLAELEKDFTCLICDLTCFGAKSMSDHIRTHEGDQLTCHLCGYKCAKFGYLVLHTRLHDKELVKVAQQPEKDRKSYQCTLCEFRATKLLALTAHISTHSLPQLFACGICGSRFTSQKNLKAHASHHGRTSHKPYMCPHCDHKYTRADNLRVHMRNHTGDKPYACSVCDFKCTRADILKSHVRGHTGEKPYACTKCVYRCRQPGLLKVHMRSHTGERPFECHICGKNFGFAMNLKVHMRTHTGEKPFACTFCDYRSTTAMNLRSHVALHEDRQFACDRCPYSCSTQGSLDSHRATHSGDIFECNFCHFKTNQVQCIHKHLESHAGRLPWVPQFISPFAVPQIAQTAPQTRRNFNQQSAPQIGQTAPQMAQATPQMAQMAPQMLQTAPQLQHFPPRTPHLAPQTASQLPLLAPFSIDSHFPNFSATLPQFNWMGLGDTDFHEGPVRVIKIQSPLS
ncbi:ZnF_C2H2 [Nesidiocoris tenuis]|uniref:ZnF_C2H2 n=1 Tax=Nesidiocoris tenuis TaxID=355587 RepID=A0ABN7B3K7_9HEMI|nr:ZnF_C2H2 [Nesidiocoris tenuis]